MLVEHFLGLKGIGSKGTVMGEICPRKIIRAMPDRKYPGTINIRSSNPIYSIQEITYNTLTPVRFQLLLCCEEKKWRKLPLYPNEDNCPLREHFNQCVDKKDITKDRYACRDCKGDIAYFYFRHEQPKSNEQSFVVAFISEISENCEETAKMMADQFKNSVNFLKIESENICFYLLVDFGVPIDVVGTNIEYVVNKEIEKDFPSFDYRICESMLLKQGTTKLYIDFDDQKISINSA